MQTIPQRLMLAQRHHQAGRTAEAESLYREILQEAPEHPHALHLLGVLHHQQGRHAEAHALIERALARQGPHAVFLSNLAAVELALDRLDEAEAHCRAALQLNPKLGDACANLGAVLVRQGRLEEAEEAFRRARQLAGSEGRQGILGGVVAHLREVVRNDPANAQMHQDLGIALLGAGRPEEAVAALQESIRLRPGAVVAHTNLGAAYCALDQLDAGRHCFEEALRLDPTHAPAHSNLGAALSFQGRIPEALAQLQETLRLDPNHAQTFFHLSELVASGHYRFTENELRRMRELAAGTDLPANDRCQLHFALAQTLDRSGDYEEAFVHARQANALRQDIDRTAGIRFDPAAHRAHVDRLIAAFTPEYFERVRGFGVASELPIFVVGMMRSGTTLTEQILASHPQVHGAGELRDLGNLVGSLSRRLGRGEDYPQCLAHLDVKTTQAVAEEYLQARKLDGGGAARVVDKMPLNYLGLGIIATLFPHARIVHCLRDPIDTCLSCYFRNFVATMPFSLDLGHLGAYYREYRRLMEHWRKVLPVPIFELQYEDLTAGPEAVSRRLVECCGLPWDERCLRFHETQRTVKTASMLQVRKPMYRSAVGRWRRYEKQLQPLIEALIS
jgi:tetratricopeptide (TPR) repeat protein